MFQKIIISLCVFTVSGYSVFGASGDVLSLQENPPIPQDENTGEEAEIQTGNIQETQEQEKPQKVEDIQNDIENLEKEKLRLEFKWNTFRVGNDTLGDIIRDDLGEGEREKLELLLVNYTSLKNKNDADTINATEQGENINELRSELLSLKKKLYTALIPYIQKEKIGAFKLYIESDIVYNEKSKGVAIEIDEKEVTRDARVEKIQEQIQDNAEILREQIRVKISEKLQGKLDTFIAQEKFQGLKDESKVILFERLIEKTLSEKEALQNIENPTSVIEEKIFLFNIVSDTLNGYIDNWK
ncbi:hypothetical protein N9J72_00375 [Candidatus Gracilibacteria bacterium]|nr:hypothetical protein [Candidatus Gracilibacteria bacterium]